MSLQHYIDAFSTLRMNRSGGAVSPHKVCLLLAVMDLVEKEVIVTNRLYLDEPLQDAFTRHFDLMQQANDQNTPYLPYYHLRTSGFWHHKIRSKTPSSRDRVCGTRDPVELHRRMAVISFVILANATHRMRQANDQNTPYLPYYHMRTYGFWHHKIRACRDDAYKRLQESNSGHKSVKAIGNESTSRGHSRESGNPVDCQKMIYQP